MKKILLINSPIRLAAKPSVFPIGLGIIAAVLEERGYEVGVIDANAHRYNQEETVREALKHRDLDIIGISGLITTYGFQKSLTRELKRQMPQVKLVLGGGCVTSMPEMALQQSGADFAVLHEGEDTVIELLETVTGGGDLDNVAGIAFCKDGKYIKTKKRNLIDNLARVPLPAYKKFPLEIYIDNLTQESRDFNRGLATMPVICSRGCPFDCNFCFHFFGEPSYRTRPVPDILREIDLLKDEYSIGCFSLIDENLIVNRQYLELLCAGLKKRGVIWECWGRADLADDRLGMMADAGCVRIAYGVESGSPKILNNMNKKITPDLIRKAIRNTRRYGIKVETTWIYGYPGETIETLRETYLLKKELKLRPGGFFINPYPGTKLYGDCLKDGRIKNEEEFIRKLSDAVKFIINFTDLDDDAFIRVVRGLERSLAIANCLRDPRYLFGVLKYKWQNLKGGPKKADTRFPY